MGGRNRKKEEDRDGGGRRRKREERGSRAQTGPGLRKGRIPNMFFALLSKAACASIWIRFGTRMFFEAMQEG